ncbi:autotransporter outer membrane beta-barrel domain-containing protein [Xanthomonas axonopodis]|uniref:autotransporter outer membrane beta-barrel domain-containing protein n=1 Tax=Xanthomonas axonopodis TaxID=53413 RepID=UPI003557D98F
MTIRSIRPASLTVSISAVLAASIWAFPQPLLAADVFIDGAQQTYAAGLFGINDDVFIGNDATGALLINGGNFAARSNLYLGRYARGDGTLTLADSDTLLSLGATDMHAASYSEVHGAGLTVIGGAGKGAVNIIGGARMLLDNAGAVVLGKNVGGEGTITVSGLDDEGRQSTFRTLPSWWGREIGDLSQLGPVAIGDAGSGQVLVSAGGRFISNGYTYLGYGETGAGSVTVSGAGSEFSAGAGVVVGKRGTGSMTIQDGGRFSFKNVGVGFIILGDEEASSGTLTVTGVGSTMDTDPSWFVGNAGTGVLRVEDGASVKQAWGGGGLGVGWFEGANGTVTVTGAGSLLGTNGTVSIGKAGVGTVNVEDGGKLTMQGDTFVVGDAGTGTMNVKNGGTLSAAHEVYLGGYTQGEAGSGTMTVSGATSSLSGAGIQTGYRGTGVLTVEDGARVKQTYTPGSFGVGWFEGANGTVTVTGAGSVLDTTGTVSIGKAGVGTVNVEDGGKLISHGGKFVVGDAGTGTMNVEDGGTLTMQGNTFVVGDAGTGTMNVKNGGTLSAAHEVYLGGYTQGEAGSGTMTVSGATSSLSGAGIQTGYRGTGVLTVEDGASVKQAWGPGSFGVGWFEGANGTVTVTGAGSVLGTNGTVSIGKAGVGTVNVEDGGKLTMQGGTFVVGDAGTGTMNVKNGGTLSAAHEVYLGGYTQGEAGSGTMTVSGATSSSSGAGIQTGYRGTGVLTVEDGARFKQTYAPGGFAVGWFEGANGTVTVTGAGSVLDTTGTVSIGKAGVGTVNVEDGGKLISHGGKFVVGDADAGTGTMNVEDGGTLTMQGNTFVVGDAGTGTMNVKNGGTLSAAHEVYLGGYTQGEAGSGTMTVSGATSSLSGAGIQTGYRGTGVLTVEDGARVKQTYTPGSFGVGWFEGANGTVTVTGAGSVLDTKGNVYIGKAGVGTLAIADGGSVSMGRNKSMYLGSDTGSIGTLAIGAAADSAAVAAGTFTTGDGAIHIGAGTGNVILNHTDSNYALSKNLVVANGGTLNLQVLSGLTTLTTSTWAGNMVLKGGTLRLGSETSLGTGNISFSGGMLDFGTDSTSHSAQTLTLNSGVVRADLSGLGNEGTSTSNLFTSADKVERTLIAASAAIGSAAKLSLQDSSGTAVSSTADVSDGTGGAAGLGAWGVKLALHDNDLAIAAGLQSVDIYADKALALNLADSGSATAIFDAKLSGAGGVALDAAGGAITFGNSANTYAGASVLTAGTLDLATDNALGKTSSLSLAANTTVNLLGNAQAVGTLNTASGSTFNLGGGALSVSGGTVDGTLAGGGSLTFASGSTAVTGANPDLSAAVDVASGATVLLSQGDGLGHGGVALDGTLEFANDAPATLGNVLSGNGALISTGNWTLDHDNTYAGGTTVSAGNLTLRAAAALGSGALMNKATVTLAGAGDLVLDNTLFGAGQLVKTEGGSWTIAQDNAAFTGMTTVSDGALVLKAAAALGSGAVRNDAELRLDGVMGTMTNALTGAGLLTVAGGSTVGMSGLSGFAGSLNVAAASTLATADTDLANLASGSVNGTLSIDGAAGRSFVLGSRWTGNGTLALAAGASDDTYVLSGMEDFDGTVQLTNGRYTLDAAGSAMLARAALVSARDNVLTLATDSTGALGIGGGTLDLAGQSPVTAESLSMSGGTVKADLTGLAQGKIDTTNLFTTGDSVVRTLVHTVTGLSGSSANLTLADSSGASLTPLSSELEDADAVAIGLGSWGLKLGQQANDLVLGFGLQSVDIYADKALALNLADSGSATAIFDAKLSGAGGVALDAAGGAITFGNSANTYAGASVLTAGTLDLATDNALGETSSLSLAANTTVNLLGHAQAVGTLNTASGSTFNLGGGALNVSGGTVDGTLAGGGSLTFASGSTAVTGANPDLSAAVDVASGATVLLSQGDGLGHGGVTLDGTLALLNAKGRLGNALSGSGTLRVDPSDITLSGDNSDFTGTMDIADADSVLRVSSSRNLGGATVTNAGTLVVDAQENESLSNTVTGTGNFTKAGSGILTIGASLQTTGTTTVDGGTLVLDQGSGGAGAIHVNALGTLTSVDPIAAPVINEGTLSVLNALDWGSDRPNQDLHLDRGLTNAGLLDLAAISAASAPGNTVTVSHGYVGNGGAIRIRTVLAGDDASTDRLIIDGGSATGHTSLIVDNAGGAGVKTSTGIGVVKTLNGATTTTDAFSLDSRSKGYRQRYDAIAAGAYDYSLKRGGNGGVADDWYLVSASLFRPEVGSYLANRRAATSMFDLGSQQRMGAAGARSSDEMSADEDLWVYASSVATSYGETHGQKITQDSSNFLTGLNAYRADAGATGSIRAGAMLGYGRASTSSRLAATGERATGTVRGVTGGVYGTWFADGQEPKGAYVDGSLRYGSYRNSVQGEGLDTERYDASEVVTSLEGGYGVRLTRSPTQSLYLEPRVRVVYDHYRQATHTELSTDTRVVSNQPDNVTFSAGLRLHGFFGSSDHQVQPFASVDWYRGAKASAVSFDGERIDSEAARSYFEFQTGASAALGHNFAAWGGLGIQAGAGHYTGVMAQGGLKYVW